MATLSIRIDILPAGRLGPGKVLLLERIAEYGSISAAGRSMGMSYKRAWQLVAALNELFSEPVVDAHIGGRNGGATSLTALGKSVIENYRLAEREAARAASSQIDAIQSASKQRRSR